MPSALGAWSFRITVLLGVNWEPFSNKRVNWHLSACASHQKIFFFFFLNKERFLPLPSSWLNTLCCPLCACRYRTAAARCPAGPATRLLKWHRFLWKQWTMKRLCPPGCRWHNTEDKCACLLFKESGRQWPNSGWASWQQVSHNKTINTQPLGPAFLPSHSQPHLT